MNSSEVFRNFRNMLELKQSELASLLSIEQSTLSNYETGKRKPSLKICYKLIKLLKLKDINVDLEDLRPEI